MREGLIFLGVRDWKHFAFTRGMIVWPGGGPKRASQGQWSTQEAKVCRFPLRRGFYNSRRVAAGLFFRERFLRRCFRVDGLKCRFGIGRDHLTKSRQAAVHGLVIFHDFEQGISQRSPSPSFSLIKVMA